MGVADEESGLAINSERGSYESLSTWILLIII